MGARGLVRVAAGAAMLVVLAGCGATASTAPTTKPSQAAPSARPAQSASVLPTAAPTPALATPSAGQSGASNYWPFVASFCPGVSEQPLVLVALGTSETAGYGIRSDEAYSPKEAYPGQYAGILCKEVGKTVELRSYFPSQSSNEWATLSWWKMKLEGDASLRAGLGTADVLVIWPLSIHQVVRPLLFGECAGDWPDPLKACFEGITATIPAEMDARFATIEALVPEEANVLAAGSYAPPALLNAWAERPYWPEVWAMTYPGPTVQSLAPKHGFTYVDTGLAINGPTGDAMPAAGLFQADGLHPTAEGSLEIAKAFAAADGLGD
jgi:hypothetical protein